MPAGSTGATSAASGPSSSGRTGRRPRPTRPRSARTRSSARSGAPPASIGASEGAIMADAVTSTASSAARASSTTKPPTKGIAQNFDACLLLLTTQLKNQSPLDPLDTNQFTQQLVQFASVEQQLRSNDTLTALLTTVKASTTSTAASFIGRQVTADGATTRLANGSARWVLNAARNASQAVITILDMNGDVPQLVIGSIRVPMANVKTIGLGAP